MIESYPLPLLKNRFGNFIFLYLALRERRVTKLSTVFRIDRKFCNFRVKDFIPFRINQYSLPLNIMAQFIRSLNTFTCDKKTCLSYWQTMNVWEDFFIELSTLLFVSDPGVCSQH